MGESISTLYISSETSIPHRQVLAKVRRKFNQLFPDKELSEYESSWRSKQNKKQPCYVFPHDIGKYIKKTIGFGSNRKSQFIYIFECNGNYKIGVASDIAQRLKMCQTGNAYCISLFYGMSVENPFYIEQYLHRLFKPKQMIGEWFNLSKNDLEVASQFIKQSSSQRQTKKNVNVTFTEQPSLFAAMGGN